MSERWDVRDNGEVIVKMPVRQTTLQITLMDDVLDRIARVAALQDMTISDLVRSTVLAIDVPGEVRSCEWCGKDFIVRDKRMRFCSKRCANAARYKRWRDAKMGDE